jgi:hypothetical protein
MQVMMQVWVSLGWLLLRGLCCMHMAHQAVWAAA